VATAALPHLWQNLLDAGMGVPQSLQYTWLACSGAAAGASATGIGHLWWTVSPRIFSFTPSSCPQTLQYPRLIEGLPSAASGAGGTAGTLAPVSTASVAGAVAGAGASETGIGHTSWAVSPIIFSFTPSSCPQRPQ
jgi:hypothetical protein